MPSGFSFSAQGGQVADVVVAAALEHQVGQARGPVLQARGSRGALRTTPTGGGHHLERFGVARPQDLAPSVEVLDRCSDRAGPPGCSGSSRSASARARHACMTSAVSRTKRLARAGTRDASCSANSSAARSSTLATTACTCAPEKTPSNEARRGGGCLPQAPGGSAHGSGGPAAHSPVLAPPGRHGGGAVELPGLGVVEVADGGGEPGGQAVQQRQRPDQLRPVERALNLLDGRLERFERTS